MKAVSWPQPESTAASHSLNAALSDAPTNQRASSGRAQPVSRQPTSRTSQCLARAEATRAVPHETSRASGRRRAPRSRVHERCTAHAAAHTRQRSPRAPQGPALLRRAEPAGQRCRRAAPASSCSSTRARSAAEGERRESCGLALHERREGATRAALAWLAACAA
eukprot:scaffold43339_cov32-Tisochrysis_lutea.AAC.5